jgi:hypothetical protein
MRIVKSAELPMRGQESQFRWIQSETQMREDGSSKRCNCSALHKSKRCYALYPTTQAETKFLLLISVEKGRGY